MGTAGRGVFEMSFMSVAHTAIVTVMLALENTTNHCSESVNRKRHEDLLIH